MQASIGAASTSLDRSVQNGAVIVRRGNIIGWGANNLPNGVEQLDERYERPLKYAYTEHAERSAIFDAAKRGNKLDGAEMYCPWSACADCARAIGMTGIKTLIRFEMPENERWSESIAIGDRIMQEAGVEIVEMSMSGITIGTVKIGNI